MEIKEEGGDSLISNLRRVMLMKRKSRMMKRVTYLNLRKRMSVKRRMSLRRIGKEILGERLLSVGNPVKVDAVCGLSFVFLEKGQKLLICEWAKRIFVV